jgi:hypothetical protein
MQARFVCYFRVSKIIIVIRCIPVPPYFGIEHFTYRPLSCCVLRVSLCVAAMAAECRSAMYSSR